METIKFSALDKNANGVILQGITFGNTKMPGKKVENHFKEIGLISPNTKVVTLAQITEVPGNTNNVSCWFVEFSDFDIAPLALAQVADYVKWIDEFVDNNTFYGDFRQDDEEIA